MQICNSVKTTGRPDADRLAPAPLDPEFPDLNPLTHLPPAALEHVAQYFRTLSEPTRLRILNTLGTAELSVGEIAEQVDSSVANVSRHLAQMAQQGLVSREHHGTSVHYRIADPAVHELCDLVCGSIARRFDQAASARAAFKRSERRSVARSAPARRQP